MTQSDLTKADLARRPHVVHYTGTNTSGYIGFKTAEDADDFRHRAAEFGTCRLAAPAELPDGWWRPIEMFEMRGINFAISVSGCELWSVQ